MTEVPRAALAYVAGLVLVALGAVGWALSSPPSLSTLGWLSLACLVQLRRAEIGARSVVFTLSSLIVMAAYPIAGAEAATLLALWSVLAFGIRDPVKLSYNGAQDVLCAALAGIAYEGLGGPVGQLGAKDFPAVLAPFSTAVLVHAATNVVLLMVVLRLAQGASLRSSWRSIFARTAPAYLGYGIFGLLLASLWLGVELGPLSLPLLLLPLFIARWVFAQYAAEKESYEATVRTLIQAVETKDHYTRGHSERVSKGSVMIARELKMADDRVESLRYAGLLHDLGKLGVPTRILQKTGRLTSDEFAAVQQHPMRGVEIVRDIQFLGEARTGILHHHERLDGLGYPMGLRGEQIPEFARVIGVADAFDAMTTARSYRGARSVEGAVGELRRGRGSQFDPRMVDAFLAALARDGWQTATLPAERAPEGVPADDRGTSVTGSVGGGDAERSSR